ncbi:MAG: hypothetical protein ACXWDO_01030, partial [Bacteroidia bacterium]
VKFFPETPFEKLLDKKWVDLFDVVLKKKNKRIIEYLKADNKSKLDIAKFLVSYSLKKLLS